MAEEFQIDKAAIRADRWLKRMMRVGIPLAILSIAGLWAGRYFGSPTLGMLFIFCGPLALAIGFAYNIRFVMLSVRQRKAYQRDHDPR